MTFQQIILKQNELKTELTSLKKEYETKFNNLDREISELERLKEIAVTGVDVDKVKNAEEVIRLEGKIGYYDEGKFIKYPKRVDAINDAINDIASGCKKIRNEYFGVKDYSGFGDQRSNCEYGYSPRHGSIVFKVGLKSDRKIELTEEMINDCIYYLENIKAGKLKQYIRN